LAGDTKVRFHIAGVILILIGIGGAFLSLLWDVIYRSRAFSLGAVGPYKLIGLAAGLALIVAGVIAGLVLGRKAAARAGPGGTPSSALAYRLTGALLVIGGLGGTFLSLLWDVIRRGKAFNAVAIGPMKLMGILAGIILAIIGIVMVVFLARRKPATQLQMQQPPQAVAAAVQPAAAPQPQAAGYPTAPDYQQQAVSTPQPETGYPAEPAPLYQPQTAETGYQPAPVSENYPHAAETDVTMQQPVQAQEEIPFALPIEEASPAQAGAEPMEAIPVEEPPADGHYRPVQ
jgi:hypothetical protein